MYAQGLWSVLDRFDIEYAVARMVLNPRLISLEKSCAVHSTFRGEGGFSELGREVRVGSGSQAMNDMETKSTIIYLQEFNNIP